MKAAVLHAYDEKLSGSEFVRYEDVPDPKIVKPTDVIVRIGGAGVCRTDLHIVEGIWRSKVEVALPYIMGHENAGWVEEVGNGVESVKVGDAVICHPLVTSGHCLACRRGDDMHATDSRFPGINANGGYAQYLATGERSLIKLPGSLAPKAVAPYTDAGPDCVSRREEGIAPSAAGRICRRASGPAASAISAFRFCAPCAPPKLSWSISPKTPSRSRRNAARITPSRLTAARSRRSWG